MNFTNSNMVAEKEKGENFARQNYSCTNVFNVTLEE